MSDESHFTLHISTTRHSLPDSPCAHLEMRPIPILTCDRTVNEESEKEIMSMRRDRHIEYIQHSISFLLSYLAFGNALIWVGLYEDMMMKRRRRRRRRERKGGLEGMYVRE